MTNWQPALPPFQRRKCQCKWSDLIVFLTYTGLFISSINNNILNWCIFIVNVPGFLSAFSHKYLLYWEHISPYLLILASLSVPHSISLACLDILLLLSCHRYKHDFNDILIFIHLYQLCRFRISHLLWIRSSSWVLGRLLTLPCYNSVFWLLDRCDKMRWNRCACLLLGWLEGQRYYLLELIQVIPLDWAPFYKWKKFFLYGCKSNQTS